MLWACLAAAIAGLGIGLWFRIPFLLVAACLLGIATLILGPLSGWSYLDTFLSLVLLLVILEASYLVGLWAGRRSVPRPLQGPPSSK